MLAVEDARAPHPRDLRMLVDAARGAPHGVQIAAIRALGRLERRDVITDLIPLLGNKSPLIQAETANALAQALRGAALPGDSGGEQVDAVQGALLAVGHTREVVALAAISRSVGRLPYSRVEQIQAADEFLRPVLDLPVRAQPQLAVAVAAAARGLESLARARKIAPLSEHTTARLRQLAARADRTATADVRRNAINALATSGAYDVETIAAVLTDPDEEVRRIGARALASAATGFDPDERHRLIRTALRDAAAMVRYEALRAWVRREARAHGCGPLIDAMRDGSMHVALEAIDQLGNVCSDDPFVTDRLTAEARTPPPGAWHREAHALVSLAKRSRERAAIAIPAFVSHQVPHVRVYAARAAAVMDDVLSLQRLAADENDNVVEAALPALRRTLGAESDAVFVAALSRQRKMASPHPYAHPYQVIRAAAIELKTAQPSRALVSALLAALQRITEHKHETSRDVRLALIDRLRELGDRNLVESFTPLLRDFDATVATAAADAIGHWTGTPPAIDPQPLPRATSPPDWSDDVSAAIVLRSGRRVAIGFSREAPLTRQRFLRLATAGYYNGLTFHRVEPNFVIQGGSPNAHEYVGDGPFMRDEVGLETHRRGAVGISTRGRDTGDAQIFINLVDNPRLDHEYTVLGHVRPSPRDGMEVVDGILEGEVIARIEIIQR